MGMILSTETIEVIIDDYDVWFINELGINVIIKNGMLSWVEKWEFRHSRFL